MKKKCLLKMYNEIILPELSISVGASDMHHPPQ